jgi:hypothetical protein
MILCSLSEKKDAINAIYVRTICACSCRLNKDQREPERLGERASRSDMTEECLSEMPEGFLSEMTEGA